MGRDDQHSDGGSCTQHRAADTDIWIGRYKDGDILNRQHHGNSERSRSDHGCAGASGQRQDDGALAIPLRKPGLHRQLGRGNKYGFD